MEMKAPKYEYHKIRESENSYQELKRSQKDRHTQTNGKRKTWKGEMIKNIPCGKESTEVRISQNKGK